MLIYQSPLRPNAVLDAILSLVDPATRGLRLAVAYATSDGCRLLVNALSKRAGRNWKRIRKSVVTCLDFGRTEPDALVYLEDNGFQVLIANLLPGARVRTLRSSAFHPKMYLVTSATEECGVIGSANLSRRALTLNTEIVWSFREPAAGQFDAAWDEIAANSIPVTDQLVAQYRRYRQHQTFPKWRDEPPVPTLGPPEELAVFRAAVEKKSVDPTEYQAVWVQVGTASGGVGSQLELPRKGHRFFGFRFGHYDSKNHQIGVIRVLSGGVPFECKVAWHGNNRMERVNLPTPRKSGLRYAGRVVIFVRSGDAYRLGVVDVGSAAAIQWEGESAASGTLFRVSKNSTRKCGLI